MDNPNPPRQPLVYADGYSYTEIFETGEVPDRPGANRLISVFHALFTSDCEDTLPEHEPADALATVPASSL